jgi:MYXO-CTERM domain-containing protein
MKFKSLAAALVLGAAVALPAMADVITFEDAPPSLGDAVFTVGAYRFESDLTGFSGIDNSSAFVFANAPANAQGNFLFMLNNDGMVMSRTDGAAFRLTGLDTSFIAPLGGLGANLLAGELSVIAELDGGGLGFDTLVFDASDANGNFNFASWDLGSLNGAAVRAVGFFACVYQSNGSCSFSALDLPAQFALDNIRIPEPNGAALALLALGLAAAARRRRAA